MWSSPTARRRVGPGSRRDRPRRTVRGNRRTARQAGVDRPTWTARGRQDRAARRGRVGLPRPRHQGGHRRVDLGARLGSVRRTGRAQSAPRRFHRTARRRGRPPVFVVGRLRVRGRPRPGRRRAHARPRGDHDPATPCAAWYGRRRAGCTIRSASTRCRSGTAPAASCSLSRTVSWRLFNRVLHPRRASRSACRE